MRERARDEGVGLPDYEVPSAAKEVILSPELENAAKFVYARIAAARAETQRSNGGGSPGLPDDHEHVSGEGRARSQAEAEKIAADTGRRLLVIPRS